MLEMWQEMETKMSKIVRNDKESLKIYQKMTKNTDQARGPVTLCVWDHLGVQQKCSGGPSLAPGLEFDLSDVYDVTELAIKDYLPNAWSLELLPMVCYQSVCKNKDNPFSSCSVWDPLNVRFLD